MLDGSKTMYGEILSSINGADVVTMKRTFEMCRNLIIAPKIPNTVTDMSTAFSGCTSLTTAPEIPSGVTDISEVFFDCPNLTGTLIIDSNPTNFSEALVDTKITSIKMSDGSTHPLETELLATK